MYSSPAQAALLPQHFRPTATFDSSGIEALAVGLRKEFNLAATFSTESIIDALQKATYQAIQSCATDQVVVQFSSREGHIDFSYFDDLNLATGSIMQLYAKHFLRLIKAGTEVDESWQCYLRSMRLGQIASLQLQPLMGYLETSLDVLRQHSDSKKHLEVLSFLETLKPIVSQPVAFWKATFESTFNGVTRPQYAKLLNDLGHVELHRMRTCTVLNMPAYTYSYIAEALFVSAALAKSL